MSTKARWSYWGILLAILATPVLAQSAAGQSVASRCNNWAAALVSLEGNARWRAGEQDRWHQLQAPLTTSVYFCGGDTLVVENQRAALRLPNETVVRLKEKTTIAFKPPEQSFIAEVIEGVVHFITRTPRKFDIKTPYMNASVDGTEFMVAHSTTGSRVAVFEGDVTAGNQTGELHLLAGEQAAATAAQSELKRSSVTLRQSADWALYFPPVLAAPDTDADVKQALNSGRMQAANERLRLLSASQPTADTLALLAATDLYLGRVQSAKDALVQAQSLSTQSAAASAVESLLRLQEGDIDSAKHIALQATKNSADKAEPWLALSYVQQSQYQLDDALASVQRALDIQPSAGVLLARKAELQLMLGNTSQAQKTINQALAVSPALSRAHTVQGFIALNELALSHAQAAFARAAQLDPADPMPVLAQGIVAIRHGQLVHGREQIELAVALDPGLSLTRSYLGKAYYEEVRNAKADAQFELAKQLDADDPTPWFYSALLRQSENQLVAALADLDKAAELNDNRAVYRSRLLLDNDHAARSASQAQIYRALGFEQAAINQGAEAIEQAPQAYSAHRMVAQAYASDPRFESLRASESLQARLLQPVSAESLPLGLSEAGLLVQPGAGPSDLGVNEFNSLFVQEGLSGHITALAGSQDTQAFDGRLRGLYGKGAFEISHYNYGSDGYRENNDVDYQITSLFGHYQIIDGLDLQLKLRHREDEQGDVAQRFFAENYSPNLREAVESDRAELGVNYRISANSRILGLLARDESDEQLSDFFTFPTLATLALNINEKRDANKAELKYLLEQENFSWQFGGSYLSVDRRLRSQEDFQLPPSFPPLPRAPAMVASLSDYYANTYAYGNYNKKKWDVLFGASYTRFGSQRINDDNVLNPKFGLRYQLTHSNSLRVAYSEGVAGLLTQVSTLEPTQVVGFTQVFDDGDYWKNKLYGLGWDFVGNGSVNAGFEYTFRKTTNSTAFVGQAEVADKLLEVSAAKFYGYALLTDKVSVSVEAKLEDNDFVIRNAADINLIQQGSTVALKTWTIPLKINYVVNSGLTVSATATYINQDVEFYEFVDPVTNFARVPYDSDFWILDMELRYKLARWPLEVAVVAKNLTDRTYQYQDQNFQSGQERPLGVAAERNVAARVKWSF